VSKSQLVPNHHSDDMKDMFTESIEGVKSLIDKQVVTVQEEYKDGVRCQVSNIFLAGGFAESGYLHDEVKKFARRFGDIQVQRADDWYDLNDSR